MKIKEIKWKKIALFSGCGLLLASMLTLISFVNTRQKAMPCSAIEIHIDESVPHDFIGQNEVLEIINSNHKIIGRPIGSINISLLEKKIMGNPFVQKAEVYSTVDGKLKVDVIQRDPMVRIISMHDEHFYIDREGKFMPVSEHYSTPVIVASGYIFDTYAEMQIPVWQGDSSTTDSTINHPDHILCQIYDVAKFLDKDSFWNAQVEQIYINEQQEIELMPRVGNQHIILGSTENMEDKFNKLFVFYSQGLSKIGWNNYSIINLKYKNQVVCTKIKL